MPPIIQGAVAPAKKTLVAEVANMVVSKDSSADLITYSLGACIGLALYDPVRKIGGLAHMLLPDSTKHAARAIDSPSMFVDSGLPLLFRAVCNLGADRSRLVAVAAGGAEFLDSGKVFNVGARNQYALLQWFAGNEFVLKAGDLGGVTSRTLRLDLGNGRVQVYSPGIAPYDL